jgi:sugar/nucleoside kinase (ribokinase family)
MTERKYHVTGIGNAIVDVLSHCQEDFIVNEGMTKGTMALVDEIQAQALYEKMEETVEMSGGSVANSLAGLAQLGARTSFIGKVRNDTLGASFRDGMESIGIHFTTPSATGGKPTARCLISVTPDGERTMNTYIGICADITPEEIDIELIKNAQMLLIEGYLWDQESAKQAIRQAVEIARQAETKVAFSLSDVFCVDRHRDEFKALIRDYVDILFANEGEIASLGHGAEWEDTIALYANQVETLCATKGENGSVILHQGERFEIPAATVAGEVVDLTGAGDLYAAGVLYGLTHGMDIAKAGELGSKCAADIIQQMGPRSQQPLDRHVA